MPLAIFLSAVLLTLWPFALLVVQYLVTKYWTNISPTQEIAPIAVIEVTYGQQQSWALIRGSRPQPEDPHSSRRRKAGFTRNELRLSMKRLADAGRIHLLEAKLQLAHHSSLQWRVDAQTWRHGYVEAARTVQSAREVNVALFQTNQFLTRQVDLLKSESVRMTAELECLRKSVDHLSKDLDRSRQENRVLHQIIQEEKEPEVMNLTEMLKKWIMNDLAPVPEGQVNTGSQADSIASIQISDDELSTDDSSIDVKSEVESVTSLQQSPNPCTEQSKSRKLEDAVILTTTSEALNTFCTWRSEASEWDSSSDELSDLGVDGSTDADSGLDESLAALPLDEASEPSSNSVVPDVETHRALPSSENKSPPRKSPGSVQSRGRAVKPIATLVNAGVEKKLSRRKGKKKKALEKRQVQLVRALRLTAAVFHDPNAKKRRYTDEYVVLEVNGISIELDLDLIRHPLPRKRIISWCWCSTPATANKR